ncbi:hypothetical protein BC941DRAFT_469638 [Chlamydoabsidia padenii]|nr:hypothetical protein BC941DRAFT_469638 [Chlamydoabsidia padenii]
MRLSLLVLGAVSYTAAQNCNPSYNVASSGACMDQCAQDAGGSIISGYTTDPASGNFIKSLGVNCGRGTPEYTQFMIKAGTCWTTCEKSQQDDYIQREFPQSCGWYNQHKDDKCEPATTSTATTTTSESNPTPTEATTTTTSNAPTPTDVTTPDGNTNGGGMNTGGDNVSPGITSSSSSSTSLPATNGTLPTVNATLPAVNTTLPAANATLPTANATLTNGTTSTVAKPTTSNSHRIQISSAIAVIAIGVAALLF